MRTSGHGKEMGENIDLGLIWWSVYARMVDNITRDMKRRNEMQVKNRRGETILSGGFDKLQAYTKTHDAYAVCVDKVTDECHRLFIQFDDGSYSLNRMTNADGLETLVRTRWPELKGVELFTDFESKGII